MIVKKCEIGIFNFIYKQIYKIWNSHSQNTHFFHFYLYISIINININENYDSKIAETFDEEAIRNILKMLFLYSSAFCHNTISFFINKTTFFYSLIHGASKTQIYCEFFDKQFVHNFYEMLHQVNNYKFVDTNILFYFQMIIILSMTLFNIFKKGISTSIQTLKNQILKQTNSFKIKK